MIPKECKRLVNLPAAWRDHDGPHCPVDFQTAVERHLKRNLPEKMKHYLYNRESRFDEDPYRPQARVVNMLHDDNAGKRERLPRGMAKIKTPNKELGHATNLR